MQEVRQRQAAREEAAAAAARARQVCLASWPAGPCHLFCT